MGLSQLTRSPKQNGQPLRALPLNKLNKTQEQLANLLVNFQDALIDKQPRSRLSFFTTKI